MQYAPVQIPQLLSQIRGRVFIFFPGQPHGLWRALMCSLRGALGGACMGRLSGEASPSLGQPLLFVLRLLEPLNDLAHTTNRDLGTDGEDGVGGWGGGKEMERAAPPPVGDGLRPSLNEPLGEEDVELYSLQSTKPLCLQVCMCVCARVCVCLTHCC